jgi:hypothetical protein
VLKPTIELLIAKHRVWCRRCGAHLRTHKIWALRRLFVISHGVKIIIKSIKLLHPITNTYLYVDVFRIATCPRDAMELYLYLLAFSWYFPKSDIGNIFNEYMQ